MAKAVVKDGRVYMRDEHGQPFSVPEADVSTELAAGARLEAPEEFEQRQIARERGTLGQQALTVGEGALRGATFGLGTAVAAELGGEEYRQAALERAAVNPMLSVGGEVAGAIAPALLSGGAGAAGTVARLTPAGAAARLGHAAERGGAALARGVGLGGRSLAPTVAREAIRLGAAGAAEGAAYGLGSSLADAALEGTEWTAERALAGLEHGILHGGVGGAALGGGAVVVGKAGRKVLDKMIGEGKTLRQAVQEFADRRAVKAVVGNDIQTFRKLTNNGEDMARLDRVAEKLRARNIIGGTDEDMLTALNRATDDATDRLAAVATDLDNAGIRPSARRVLDEVDEQARRLRDVGTVDHKRIARRIEQEVKHLRASSTVRVARPDGTVVRVQRDPTFSELRKFKSGIGEEVNWHQRNRSMATEEMRKLYGNVARNLDAAADEAGGEAARLWREANEDAADFITLRDGLEEEIQRKAKNRWLSPSDQGFGLTGALAAMVTGAGAPAAILTGLATGVANKFIRERGSAAIGKIADWAAGVELRMGSASRKLAGRDVAAAGAAVRKTGLDRLKALGERGAVPSSEARDAGERVEARRALLRGWLPLSTANDRQERFDAATKAIRDVQRDPQALLTRIEQTVAPFADEQPEVAAAMARRIVADYQYLEAQLPPAVSSFGATIGPQKAPLVSRADQRKLLAKAEALADPVGAFEDAAAGVVNFDAIDAVRDRRPDLFESFRMRVAMDVAEAEKPLPHGRRVFLSIAFGLPLDASLEPGAVVPTDEQGGPATRPSSLDPENAAEQMTTPAQSADAA